MYGYPPFCSSGYRRRNFIYGGTKVKSVSALAITRGAEAAARRGDCANGVGRRSIVEEQIAAAIDLVN